MLIQDGFGVRLQQERVRLNKSQRELGESLGVTPNTQRAYEKGKDTINLRYLQRAENIGVNTMYVLSGRLEQENCLAKDEFHLVSLYRELSEADKARLLHFAEEQRGRG